MRSTLPLRAIVLAVALGGCVPMLSGLDRWPNPADAAADTSRPGLSDAPAADAPEASPPAVDDGAGELPDVAAPEAGSDDGSPGCQGLTRCAGACVSLRIDPDHCGACGHACGVGATCVSGACVAGGCTIDGAPCGSHECCSGICDTGRCVCRAVGFPCKSSAQCCAGLACTGLGGTCEMRDAG